MIELKNDKLSFSFTGIEASLRKLAHQHVQERLPRILNEDRNAALDELLAKNYRFNRASETERVEFRRFVHELPKAQVIAAFQNKIREQSQVAFDGKKPGRMTIEFQRTLRIPDDGRDYFLPPGLGRFPLRHVDDFADRLSAAWLDRGGVMMPMYQAEALWINFRGGYPFAVKVASGKINAITGESWRAGLNREPQDYLVVPEQPWLDGFAVEKGVIRQFVAMPLGAGYSVEEQLTGRADCGGIQIQVYPMRAEAYFKDRVVPLLPSRLADLLPDLLPHLPEPREFFSLSSRLEPLSCIAAESMGLGAGGRMKQEIYEDTEDMAVWDLTNSSRCFIHLCNSAVWREITGTNPPQPPVTAKEYERAGLPWFDYYRDDLAALEGPKTLAGVKSVVTVSKEKGDHAVTGNDPVKVNSVKDCGPVKRPNQVREWALE